LCASRPALFWHLGSASGGNSPEVITGAIRTITVYSWRALPDVVFARRICSAQRAGCHRAYREWALQ
jgi:hypothetical protein